MKRVVELSLTKSEMQVLQQELTELLATKVKRRSRSRVLALGRVLEKVELASKAAVRSGGVCDMCEARRRAAVTEDRKELESLIWRTRKAGADVLVDRDIHGFVQGLAVCLPGVSSHAMDLRTATERMREWLAKRTGEGQ